MAGGVDYDSSVFVYKTCSLISSHANLGAMQSKVLASVNLLYTVMQKTLVSSNVVRVVLKYALCTLSQYSKCRDKVAWQIRFFIVKWH